MQFTEGEFYHIYNRGNNKQTIFFQERNYDFFLQKVKKYLASHNNLIAWCLMPNHFHFLIQANDSSKEIVKRKPLEINAYTEGIRLLLSSYTKAIQKQESLVGNLFQQKTKVKCVDGYEQIAFHYIHQNALRAGLVQRVEDWKWSSFPEYLGVTHSICNIELAFNHLDINADTILYDSYSAIPDDVIEKLF